MVPTTLPAVITLLCHIASSNIPNSVYKVAKDCSYESQFFLEYTVFLKHVFPVPSVLVNAHTFFKGFHALKSEFAIDEEVFSRFGLCSTNGEHIIIHHSHAFESMS